MGKIYTALGLMSGTSLDGVDFSSVLLKGGPFPSRSIYFHFPIYLQAYNPLRDDGRDPLFRTRPGSVIRKGNWKLHEYFEDGALELYNLSTDLGETRNVASSFPKITQALYNELKEWRATQNADVPTNTNPDYDPVASAKFLVNQLNRNENLVY